MGAVTTDLKITLSEESKAALSKAFDSALSKLALATPSSRLAHVEANNHFDADFHQKLLRGEHLNRQA